MSRPDPRLLAALARVIDAALAQPRERPLVLGLCGAQGSGKSTLAAALAEIYAARGTPCVVLSLDDLYLPLAGREGLGRDVHPLLRTRGVPGTHDVALGLETLAALDRGDAAPLPRFDKARDDRTPESQWNRAAAGCRLVLFEGWCVGARPQDGAALAVPVNDLERLEDPAGLWRRHVNTALATVYRPLFDRVDRLALLAAPGFEVVLGWRRQQEEELRRRAGADAPGLMDEAALRRFVSHYERLTRHILAEMPARADFVAHLDARRRAVALSGAL